ncbi:MAG TPA: ROK family protein [Candidatus Saccharimonadales bacterium]|nr:ROK family protein [Candidatus Saccharimonadales bacterium]
MYVGIDIGGTKTLVAVLNNEGVIEEQLKFPTKPSYPEFIEDLKATLAKLKTSDFKAGGLAIPAVKIDRKNGIGESYGNLPWHNTPVQHDIEQILNCPIALDNDAKLAALSEAMLLKDQYKSVLYVTISTGIGYGLVIDGLIDENIGDGGGRTILLEHNGKMIPWEDFASGHAIVERYGKQAKDINDDQTWKQICNDLAKGLVELIAITEPEVIVFGGSVGAYFEKYSHLLEESLNSYSVPLITMPRLIKAQRPEEAVVYGCYDLARLKFGAR